MKIVHDDEWEGLVPRLTQGEWKVLDEAETILARLQGLMGDLMDNKRSAFVDWAEPWNELSDALEGLASAKGWCPMMME
jgi:hypothetical protein